MFNFALSLMSCSVLLGLAVSTPAVARDRPTNSTAARPASTATQPAIRNRSSPRRPTPPRRSNRSPHSTSSRRPAPPRRLPPNQIQPGGGLDAAAQACDPANSPLTALVPKANPVYTTKAHPTFLFHISDDPDQLTRAEFMLLSSDEKREIYAVEFIPESAGVVSVSLPASTGSGLAVDEAYHWYLNVYCQNSDTVIGVNGWVERVSPLSRIEAISTGAALTGTALTESGLPTTGLPTIWYDEMARHAAILSTGETDNADLNVQRNLAQRRWTQWLEAIGIGDIASRPVVGPVVPLPVPKSYSQLPTKT